MDALRAEALRELAEARVEAAPERAVVERDVARLVAVRLAAVLVRRLGLEAAEEELLAVAIWAVSCRGGTFVLVVGCSFESTTNKCS